MRRLRDCSGPTVFSRGLFSFYLMITQPNRQPSEAAIRLHINSLREFYEGHVHHPLFHRREVALVPVV